MKTAAGGWKEGSVKDRYHSDAVSVKIAAIAAAVSVKATAKTMFLVFILVCIKATPFHTYYGKDNNIILKKIFANASIIF